MFVVSSDGRAFAPAYLVCRLASDACVDTLARPAGAGRLAGRPGPHGRRSLRTAFAAGKTSRPSPCVGVFSGGLA